MFRGSIMICSLAVDDSDEAHCKQFGVDAVLRNPTVGILFLQKVAALCRRQKVQTRRNALSLLTVR